MVNYAITSYTIVGSHDTVVAALETEAETVDNTKTIRLWSVVPKGNDFIGILQYDT